LYRSGLDVEHYAVSSTLLKLPRASLFRLFPSRPNGMTASPIFSAMLLKALLNGPCGPSSLVHSKGVNLRSRKDKGRSVPHRIGASEGKK
jgi:hypothetical protein